MLGLVLLPVLIASPIAAYLMQQWLQSFVYRIDITWDFFVLAGIISGGIALLTVSYHALMAAQANPVKSLRSE